jgi:hypothetical protein
MLFLPEGETNELPLLFANYCILSRGGQVRYIGLPTPMEGLWQVFENHKTDHILTVITTQTSGAIIDSLIAGLVKHKPGMKIKVVNESGETRKEFGQSEDVEQFNGFTEFLAFLDKPAESIKGRTNSNNFTGGIE